MTKEHFLDRTTTVNRWDNSYPSRLTIASGDVLTLRMKDASDGQVRRGMSSEEFGKIDKTRIHALTGPVMVEGAMPGDRLVLDILSYEHEGWAWTSIIPELGLLPEDFPEHYIHFWDLEKDVTRSMPGLTIPLQPFCGIIGVQREEAGEFRTRAPGVFGGNMDVRHLTAGNTLHLPVLTEGAGLCAGDAHATQGDGEVCINGMEAPMSITMKVTLVKNSPLAGPFIECKTPLDPPAITDFPHHLFIESDAEFRPACQRVVRRAIRYLQKRLGLTAEQAYVTCSVTLRLKVSQLVNVPTVTITGYLPEGIFDKHIVCPE